MLIALPASFMVSMFWLDALDACTFAGVPSPCRRSIMVLRTNDTSLSDQACKMKNMHHFEEGFTLSKTNTQLAHISKEN